MLITIDSAACCNLATDPAVSSLLVIGSMQTVETVESVRNGLSAVESEMTALADQILTARRRYYKLAEEQMRLGERAAQIQYETRPEAMILLPFSVVCMFAFCALCVALAGVDAVFGIGLLWTPWALSLQPSSPFLLAEGPMEAADRFLIGAALLLVSTMFVVVAVASIAARWYPRLCHSRGPLM